MTVGSSQDTLRADGVRIAPVELVEPAAVRPRPGIVTHYLRYSTASVLVILAGFVSFPVLTRLLDNTQYGILGYYETWLMLAVGVVKLGAQHSIVRFYSIHAGAGRLEHFATNLFLVPLLISLTLWALVAAGLVAFGWLGGHAFPAVFWCAVFLIPITVIGIMVVMVLNASERSLLATIVRVVGRWLEVALILGAVIVVERSALSVYGGRIVATLLMITFYVYWVSRNLHFSRRALDWSAVGGSLRYGLPLAANEIATVALISIDRVMLKEMTGDFAMVGIYTIGYSLAIYVGVFMHATLYEAFVPVVNRMHAEQGSAGVRALKNRILLPLTYAAIGVAAMLWGVGAEVLVALSGPGKAASGAVFAVIGMSYALYPLIDVGGYGLLLQKRTVTIFAVTSGAMTLNVVLNLLLIPSHGIMGAVWATVASYAFLGAAHCLLCPRDLLCFPDPRALALALVCAALLLAVIEGGDLFGIQSPWLRLLAAGCVFPVVYALPVWLLDPRLRDAVQRWRRGTAVEPAGANASR